MYGQLIMGRKMVRVEDSIEKLARDDLSLVIFWSDGHKSHFDYIWLRDSCRCAECGDPLTATKKISVADIPPTTRARLVVVEGPNLKIEWEDGHPSVYSSEWLRARCNCSKSRTARRHLPMLWDSSLSGNLIAIPYSDFSEGDEGLLAALEQVRDRGFSLIRSTPVNVSTLESIAAMIGYIRETNYGRVYDLVVMPNAKLFANQGVFVPPHTDEAYRYHAQGLALFHCLQAAKGGGGVTILVDGFKVAEDLRRENPAAFELLTRVPQQFAQRYDGLDLRSAARLIACDFDGQIVGVRFNTLGSIAPDLPQELIAPFYDALRKLAVLHRDTNNWLQIPLEPGDLLIIDNERVLHGRTAFNPQADKRHLRLCYIDRDGYHSTLRILGRKLGRLGTDLVLPSGVAN
jgi:gamma-butyrobetaine dioxygenase